MWSLMLITIINGGASPSQIETQIYQTREQCIVAEHKQETVTRYGYCTLIGRK